MRFLLPALAALTLFDVGAACSADLAVRIDGLGPDGSLPASAAFCRLDAAGKQTAGQNRSLGLSWSAGPAGTRSYSVLMTDPDVPQDLSLLARPDPIPADAPRQTIFHWVLVDIPAGRTALAAGEDGAGVAAGGKPVGPTGHGTRGHNTFHAFFARDPKMAGPYGGYDGPCPPANDLKTHEYRVRVLALDVPHLELGMSFDGPAVEAATEGHVLAVGEATGTYSLNEDAR